MIAPSARPLTRRQREVLDYIRSRAERDGYPPTTTEIGRRFGITTLSGVNSHLNALELKGYIRRRSCLDPDSRAITVIAQRQTFGGGGCFSRDFDTLLMAARGVLEARGDRQRREAIHRLAEAVEAAGAGTRVD